MKRIAVVGGGIAGLAAAYYLRQGAARKGIPLEIYLLEKEGRLGGAILTELLDGFLIEGGPDCLLAEKPWALELAQELGIGHRVVDTLRGKEGTYVLWRGRLHLLPEGFVLLAPTSFTSLLRWSLISPWGKLRVALEPFLPRGPQGGDESLADFVSRRLGREVLEKVAEPLVAGIHGGAPEELSLKSTFPRLLELERRHRSLILGLRRRRKGRSSPRTPFVSFRGGMGELVEALEGALEGVEVRRSCEVLGVERGDGFRLRLRGEDLGADAMILATPSYVSAQLLKSFAPELSGLLERIPYVSSATLSLAYEAEGVAHLLRGYGFVVPRREGRRLMAVTFSSRKFPGRAPDGKVLLRAFVGGARDEGVLELEDREILALVRGELEEILGIRAEPLLWRLYRWPRSLAQYRVGHGELLAEIEAKASEIPGLFLAGAAYRGIGVGDCVRSGREAAQRALDFLR